MDLFILIALGIALAMAIMDMLLDYVKNIQKRKHQTKLSKDVNRILTKIKYIEAKINNYKADLDNLPDQDRKVLLLKYENIEQYLKENFDRCHDLLKEADCQNNT